MNNKLAETGNVKRLLEGIGAVERRGAREASWLAAIGEPGNGKTRTLQWWSTHHNGAYLRAKTNWRPNWMLAELAGELTGTQTPGGTRALYELVVRELMRQGRPIIIDEAWNMLHDARLLETLRDISDLVENLIIIGGEHRVTARLSARFPQIASRISEVIEFGTATIEDIRICCDTLSETPIADDLAAEIFKQSGGHLREVKNAIARCEQIGKRNSGKPVKLADMGGRELCRDRKAGLPSARRAAR
jgi:hypothetical protein